MIHHCVQEDRLSAVAQLLSNEQMYLEWHKRQLDAALPALVEDVSNNSELTLKVQDIELTVFKQLQLIKQWCDFCVPTLNCACSCRWGNCVRS